MARQQIDQRGHAWRPKGAGEWTSRLLVPVCGADLPDRHTENPGVPIPPSASERRCPECVEIIAMLTAL